jgi:hypothetical protein
MRNADNPKLLTKIPFSYFFSVFSGCNENWVRNPENLQVINIILWVRPFVRPHCPARKMAKAFMYLDKLFDADHFYFTEHMDHPRA